MLCVQASNALLRSARLSGASRRSIQSFGKSFLQVSDEVHDAVQTGKPVVALETTIYTHGKTVSRAIRFLYSMLQGFLTQKTLRYRRSLNL